ncbi:Autophagy- protein 7 (Autophagy- E1-like activating enzyme atg7) [Verticillium nonalfalfae]|uniref:Ubiquitin-like modifier-activating enzyme ATG7 n=1 Tax=Verticillium nonalfalfae TaxID=1051616 RepID=A0A3M9Y9X1_9PEZI|nr:Autophagy- protein 7 (Autophagy- E1-like activating enzyme atg7) [Verticillium nonalfalfae]RNJ56762.1 Autophagy- protein 7 (Autophagy- E1-like activating enzyme atg7) [Verticillium nonalfalfae]
MTLQFAPFSSDIELPFYAALFASKVDHDKLDDSVRKVIGQYTPLSVAAEQSCKMQIMGDALTRDENDNEVRAAREHIRAEGSIKNFNTLDEFKNADKQAMLQLTAKHIWHAINDGSIYEVPSLLSSFMILSYADLKKYRFTYWFAFPALHSDPQWKKSGPVVRLTPKESVVLVDRVGTWTSQRTNSRQNGFFLAKKVRNVDLSNFSEDGNSELHDLNNEKGYLWEIGKLSDFETGFFNDIPPEDCYVSFVDSSTYAENPSWPLRNLLWLIRQRFRLSKVNILCYRELRSNRYAARSIIIPLETEATEPLDVSKVPKVTGWERDSEAKLRARVANLADYMDPARLADQSVDLNLKLMKWRISPNLDLDAVSRTKCLLLGAGTLGSYVSRNLLGWGVRKITFVDYGRVSFSNPVRQPLFEFDDCLGGGKAKAPQAAEALKRIYPGVESEGHTLSVPMLGHPFTDEAKVKADFDKLQQLIDDHDAIFLLMDSRESRWLPSVMGKAAGKIVMNAALGFDSFVVMRHGAEPKDVDPCDKERKTLGCYFCNDVVAPVDSQKNLTLDQQCTVTRPGVAAIASAQLVELLASLLQHPLKHHAAAPQISAGAHTPRDPPDHALGLVPHQIRGFVSTFENLVIRGESYPCCSACGPPVLDAFRADGWEFVKRALLEKDYVAELSGLAEVQRQAELLSAEVEWEEEESLEEGDGELI